jgi:DNA polymerase-1
MLVIDIESYDPNLSSMGDGSMRKDGVVFLVGTYDGKDYRPYDINDNELRICLQSSVPKIFHNSTYDLSWLVCGYNLEVNGTLHDTMTRAALIDEYADLDLDSCCKRFKITGKNADSTIEKWFERVKAEWGLRGDVWDNADLLWSIPAGKQAMIEYNKQDCIATYNLFLAQEPFLKDQNEAYELECQLQPVILEMKRNGIRMDLVARDRLIARMEKELSELEQQLNYGYNITRKTIASPKQLTFAMNQLGIHSSVKTTTGAESWTDDALSLISHPAIELIQKAKKCNTVINKYLHGSLSTCLVDDRLHCTFYANKRDEGGTITGRLSSRKPNLQAISAREDKYGKEIRSLFLPEEGTMLAAIDFSQIEYLLLAHYAQGPQADWFRQQACNGVDFHTVAMSVTGIKERDQVKRLNYGIIYGMGVNKMFTLNRKLFGTLANTKTIFDTYHNGLPVIRDTMNAMQFECEKVGYVYSIGNRIHHKPRAEFINGRWNSLIYKITNYRLQGSAADIMKKAMVDIWKKGLQNTVRLQLTVHDELVASIPYNKQGTEATQEMIECMEGAYKERLLVPMKANCEVGPNWGWWAKDIWEEMKEGKYERIAHKEE